MESDRVARSTLARKDDEERQEKVFEARAIIYEDGYVVNAQKVDEILKDESLVPTVVCFVVHCSEVSVTGILMRRSLSRSEHILKSSGRFQVQCILVVGRRSDARV